MRVVLWTRLAVLIIVSQLLAPSAHAHFLWLAIDGGQGHLFFSEAGDVAGTKLPESIEAAEVWTKKADGQLSLIELKRVESNGEISMVADLDQRDPICMQTSCQYGLYHGVRLHYFAKSVQLSTAGEEAVAATEAQRLDLHPHWSDEALKVRLTWDGAAVASAEINVITPDAAEHDLTSDKDGWITLPSSDPGLYSVRANQDDDESGELDGEKFKRSSYYSTLTFRIPGEVKDKTAQVQQASGDANDLPEGLASFGAAMDDGYLYVYGGHIGRAHTHSKENISHHFRRIRLRDGSEWEPLPMQTGLQGLPLVAHGGYLYRVGGLQALNAQGEPDDLHSVDEFCRFDPKTNSWTSLPPLPAPRSSHDAVVMDGKIYVAGGWNLSGDDDGEWHTTALVYDLESDHPEWQEIETSFTRRAVAVGSYEGKIYVIGGIDDFGDIDRQVNVFDPTTGEWKDGPELPGDGMQGFGASAWQAHGQLFVSGSDGTLYRLAADANSWESHGALKEPRFFHRLLPLGDLRLVAVGGASMKGHLTDIEHVVCEGQE